MASNRRISGLDSVPGGNLSSDDEFIVIDKDVIEGPDAGEGGKTSTVSLNDLTNAIGAAGPSGDKGDKGNQGNPGDTGNSGPDGQDGAIGEKGQKGSRGWQGDEGPEGPKGAKGVAGADGIDATGIKGESGQHGEKGQKGAQGADASDGIDGTKGARGELGQKGQAGTDGTDGTDGDKGQKGQSGIDGVNGTNGTDGDKGQKGHGGSGGINGTKGQKGDLGNTGTKGEPAESNAGGGFIGMITSTARTNLPQGWMECDGSSLSISEYPNLFNAIGYSYGGQGDVFSVPDLRGRVVAGHGPTQRLTGIDESHLGNTGGASTHTLTTDQMPKHYHRMRGPNSVTAPQDNKAYPSNSGYYGGGTADDRAQEYGTFSTGSGASDGSASTGTGLGAAHNNIQPTIILKYIIKYESFDENQDGPAVEHKASVLTGAINNGAQIPLPVGYTQEQCSWIVSSRVRDTNHGDHHQNHDTSCYTNSERVVTVGGVGGGSGTANYMIIGLK